LTRDNATAVVVAFVAILSCAGIAFASGNMLVVQTARSFHPGEITIAAGSTIDVANQDEFIHQIYVDTPGFDYDSEEQEPGQTFHIKFPAAGTFSVRCHIHPKMLLIVHVK
jgi:plastocyanin